MKSHGNWEDHLRQWVSPGPESRSRVSPSPGSSTPGRALLPSLHCPTVPREEPSPGGTLARASWAVGSPCPVLSGAPAFPSEFAHSSCPWPRSEEGRSGWSAGLQGLLSSPGARFLQTAFIWCGNDAQWSIWCLTPDGCTAQVGKQVCCTWDPRRPHTFVSPSPTSCHGDTEQSAMTTSWFVCPHFCEWGWSDRPVLTLARVASFMTAARQHQALEWRHRRIQVLAETLGPRPWGQLWCQSRAA